MRQQDAKPLIIREWDRWIQTQPIDPETASARDSFKFLARGESQQGRARHLGLRLNASCS
jgi:hypothetical protein